ncbi:glycosyltransferase [Pseudanabaena sp. PCC 6802]|uniref:glycosyltransferase n=1 Tax=Pseudanabaena sp. PCC 6802 TaxID=118173 RepID=UPI00034699F0|nr:glycosyltransferase [Pseudanabaena sp. PCC 6802]
MIDISVIIPCFNHGDYIWDAIASVEASQDRDRPINYELIIINDGSTAETTLDVLNDLRDRGYTVIDIENQGLANARNHGIAIASGRYILPLDSDNKIRSEYMYKGIEILDRCPQVGVVYGDVEFFGGMTGIWALPDFDLYRLMIGNYIDACAVFRKQIWQECGGYDTNIPDKLGYEDWEFWLRVAKQGWQFHHIPEVMFDYRTRSDSMVQACKQPANQKRLVHYICAKHQDLYASRLADVIADKELVAFERMYEVERLKRELQHVQSDLEHLNHLNHQYQESEVRLSEHLQAARDRIAVLENTVAAMETSKFWKLRMLWLRIKRSVS